jgi:hypothetical protein
MSDKNPTSPAYARILTPFTRRGFLQRAGLAAAGVVAITLTHAGLTLPVAYAEGCRNCYGPCAQCTSFKECCSPGGLVCQQAACTCNIWASQGISCNPPCVFVALLVCDDGSFTANCVACC